MPKYELIEKIKRLFGIKPKSDTETRFIWYNTIPTCPERYESNLRKNNVVKTSRYRIWNFLFLNLFEQFQKLANFYFLVLALILTILDDKAPISSGTTTIPLIFVVCVTAGKQGYEDVQRHKADRLVNNRMVTVLKDGKLVEKIAADVKLGDIIYIKNDEEFPCDMILLSSSLKKGNCFITTVNFDGETNLKTRYCAGEPEVNLDTFSCCMEYEPPNYDLYRFNGKIKYGSKKGEEIEKPLSTYNYLLRGSFLRNTEYVYGMAIFIGDDTKMAMNSQDKRRKVSIVDKKLNKFILSFICILFIGASISTTLHYTLGREFSVWYIERSEFVVTASSVFINMFTYISLLNYLVPISLYVTVELQKFINTVFIDCDLDMYHAETDEPAHSSTSDIVEELGQVQYIFTDKTGTLTQNQMEFKKCFVPFSSYSKCDSYLHCTSNDTKVSSVKDMDEKLEKLFMSICLCHTAEVGIIKSEDGSPDKLKYMASSPDEIALLEAAYELGMVYRGREDNVISVTIDDKLLKFHIAHVLEFDAVRKRMSVIAKDESGNYKMICKGAESSVLPLCNNNEHRETILKCVDSFAQVGLRTLAFAYKPLTQEEYQTINEILSKSQLQIVERDKALAEAYEIVERDFIALGTTGVEDILQDMVEDTLRSLRLAGIKIWVLTGDKEETAVSISFSCGHLTNDMDILYLCQRIHNIDDVLNEYINRIESLAQHKFALVIDGFTLRYTMQNLETKLSYIFTHADTVLCCRMSPLQKSQIVNFMRMSKDRPVTLAIGDGANDCSMIQEAHIGIGIMGKEGRQAVYSSDYAIHDFKYLKKLLLFHGYNFYNRISDSIHFFFYKNALLVSCMFTYVYLSMLSPSSLFSDPQLTIYNTLITALPIMAYGVLEQNYTKQMTLNNPRIYKSVRRNTKMSWIRLVLWSLNGVWQGLIVLLFTYFMYNNGRINVPYQYMTVDVYGTFVYSYLIFCATIQICFMTRFWTLYTLFLVVGSIIFYFICASFVTVMYSFNPNNKTFAGNFQSYFAFFTILSFPDFWIGLCFIIPLAFLPYFVVTIIDQIRTHKAIFPSSYTSSHRLGRLFPASFFSNDEEILVS